jgi:hypothetical protein
VSADGETRTLSETATHSYAAQFDIDDADTEFVFAFIRSEQDESALRSTVTLLEALSLEMTASEASRADARVGFSWDLPPAATCTGRSLATAWGPTRATPPTT